MLDGTDQEGGGINTTHFFSLMRGNALLAAALIGLKRQRMYLTNVVSPVNFMVSRRRMAN